MNEYTESSLNKLKKAELIDLVLELVSKDAAPSPIEANLNEFKSNELVQELIRRQKSQTLIRKLRHMKIV